MLVTSTSSYRVPYAIKDLMVDPGERAQYFQRFHHEGYEIYYGRARFLISAGGVYRAGWDPTFFNHVSIDGVASAMMNGPAIGTLVGEAAIYGFLKEFAEKNAASALPTVLLPRAHGLDRTDLIRINGAIDREKRNNTCVAPPGFACGLDLVVPKAMIDHCSKTSGRWTFIDLAKPDNGCEDDGLFVVVWTGLCDTDQCRSDAGADDRNYGFFEVIEAGGDFTIDDVMTKTLAHNAGRSFASQGESTYTPIAGSDVHFEFDSPVETWGIDDDAYHAPGETTRDMTSWRPIQGGIVSNLYPTDQNGNLWRKACVEVMNFPKNTRRILDFSQVDNPQSCNATVTPLGRYGCARERCRESDG